MRKSLPDYMIPAFFMEIEQMPYNINGKIDKKELLNGFHMEHMGNKKEPPRNKKEQEILEVWKEVLRCGEIGIDDNFFELGGDSLKLIRIISLLSKKNIPIAFSEVFQLQTIRNISSQISKNTSGENRKKNFEKFPFDSIEQPCFDAYQKINREITRQPVEFNYLCSAIQNITLREKFQPVILLIPEVDSSKKDELEQILCREIAAHDLLRSTIIQKENQNMVLVHQWENKKNSIPVIWIEGNMAQYDRYDLVKEIVNYHHIRLFGYEKALFHCFILQDSSTALFVFIASHGIFDAVSSSYLFNVFQKNAVSSKRDTYSEYADYLLKGPNGYSMQSIIDTFALEELSRFHHQEVLRRTENYERCQIRIDFAGREKPLDFLDIFRIYRKILNFNFKDLPLMCGILINSRSYKYQQFYHRVGEYLDVIPIHYAGRSDEEVEDLIKTAAEKDINFMTLSQKNLLPEYKEIQYLLSTFQYEYLNYPILNIINLLESHYYDFMDSEEASQTMSLYWTDMIPLKTSLFVNTFVSAGQKEELKSLLLEEFCDVCR